MVSGNLCKHACSGDGNTFRITFDDNILARQSDISLTADIFGRQILPDGRVLMEIKCSGAIPLWMVEILSRERIYKTPFSKYGRAYGDFIFPELKTKTKEFLHNA